MTSKNKHSAKLWGGRFQEETHKLVEQFTASVEFDKQLYRQDIQGSIAHTKMLAEVGILSAKEASQIMKGLEQIQTEIAQGKFTWSLRREDVHMNIEATLIERIGDVAKKLHTARSRNDQVATDMRLFVRDAIDQLSADIHLLQTAILYLADQEKSTIMPGFTHLQPAQPITFGHHLLAWCEMFERDYQRLQDARKRVNVMPLGSAALAGSSYPIDRNYTATLLGFTQISRNSLDAVSDRDFVIESLSVMSMIMNHLSRISEELVLWSSQQFQFIHLPDRYCTGSSIMPQKKNPDVPELIRGKTGRVTGHLVSLLILMKAQPLAYNKDNQEDKEPFFDAFNTTHLSLTIYADLIPHIKPNKKAMYEAAQQGFTTATDLADYLVRKNIPFRDAHEIVGKIVGYCITHQKNLEQLALSEFQQFSKQIEKDVYHYLTLEGSVASRDHLGGTAPKQVAKQIVAFKKVLKKRNITPQSV